MADPQTVKTASRILVGLLTLSAGGLATWKAQEGFTAEAVIPTKGDVPTIGHGSTHYGDGRKVKLGDRITRAEADTLARKLVKHDEIEFAATLPGVRMTQGEFDLYVNYVGQFGIGNWRRSSMRRELLAGNPAKACDSLLKYRFAAGYDCSTLVNGKPNRRCWGVWQRQLDRHKLCVGSL